MSLEPEKLFIGVIDFFSIILPGALLAYIYRNGIAWFVLSKASLPLQGTEGWMIFLFTAYLLGHIVFLFGSLLDKLYDWFRACTELGQIRRRLAKKKGLSHPWLREAAGWIFGSDADSAVVQASRIKSRALRALSAGSSVNAFQWCKARLSREHPSGLVTVERFEADSKFFRSFAIVLVTLAIICALHPSRSFNSLRCAAYIVFVLPVLWRYVDQRFKATQHAYWLVITLESLKEPVEPLVAAPPDADELTHAGGVVFTGSKESARYLLLQASKNPREWVLPKGHIEFGESARETAVREVHEETGYWARVVDWIDDVRLGDNSDAPMVRFFLMELVSDKGQPDNDRAERWPPEERRHKWLSPGVAQETATHQKTRQLLEDAASGRSGRYRFGTRD